MFLKTGAQEQMRNLLVVAAVVVLGILSGCSQQIRIPKYTGPEVTQVVVNKGARRMYLLHNQTILKKYDVALGFRPRGSKRFEGDGRTPEGIYHIDRRNPRSSFYLSIGISYPNRRDIAEAAAVGLDPGGDIFIHGRAKDYRKGKRDWTAGCIAVDNKEMLEIYSMVRDGTQIVINP